MGNDRFPANVQKTMFSCDRQHTLEARFFSRCRLLSPRESAKSFLANGVVGRGGGDRTRDHRLVRVHASESMYDQIYWDLRGGMYCIFSDDMYFMYPYYVP